MFGPVLALTRHLFITATVGLPLGDGLHVHVNRFQCTNRKKYTLYILQKLKQKLVTEWCVYAVHGLTLMWE